VYQLLSIWWLLGVGVVVMDTGVLAVLVVLELERVFQ
jgi:hypothetical protein